MLNLKIIEIENKFKKPLLKALISGKQGQIKLIIEKIYLEAPDKQAALTVFKNLEKNLSEKNGLLDDYRQALEWFSRDLKEDHIRATHQEVITNNKRLIQAVHQNDLEFIKNNPQSWKTKPWKSEFNKNPHTEFLRNPLAVSISESKSNILKYFLENGLGVKDSIGRKKDENLMSDPYEDLMIDASEILAESLLNPSIEPKGNNKKLGTTEMIELEEMPMEHLEDLILDSQRKENWPKPVEITEKFLQEKRDTLNVLVNHGLNINSFLETAADKLTDDPMGIAEIENHRDGRIKILNWIKQMALEQSPVNRKVIKEIDNAIREIKENIKWLEGN